MLFVSEVSGRLYVCMYVCMYVWYVLYIHVHMHTCIHTYTHTCTCTYIHTYTHTCMHAYSPNTKNISSRQKVCKLLLLSLTLLQPGCRCTSSESASIMLFQTFMRACILLRWICVNDIVSNWRTCGCVCVCVCIHVSGPASNKSVSHRPRCGYVCVYMYCGVTKYTQTYS